jgi:integrase/ferredoxin
MSAEPLRVVEGGRAPRGWEALWAKDVWRASELPHGDLASAYSGEVFIHFERLRQPWLKEASKRWARARLLGDTTPQTMRRYVTDLRHFSDWLAAHAPEVAGPALLSRALLEDYLLWVRQQSCWKPATRSHRVVGLRAWLEEQAEDGLAGLPRSAVIHRSELPRVDYRLPKQLPGGVFAQWVDPANLALLDDEQHRTVALLLAFTGFRVSSVVTLRRDAREFAPDGHPYLRYFNIKAKREAMLPIAPALSEQLERQEALLAERYPEGTGWLLPSPPPGQRNGRGGAFHLLPVTIRKIVKRYVSIAQIRGGDGELVLGVHPHLFRHHVGTSMVNEKIPLTVIQKVLDHGSIVMTAHYARLHDETVKQEVWRWHERVNIRGERIALPTDGPLQEAAWMKERIAHAKQALPNGYCGLPLVASCPHPNACLSCASFLTDGWFRAVHEQQHGETHRLLEKARKNDNVRLIEVLERDEQCLSRIIEGLDAIEADQAGGGQLDLLELAACGEAEGA